MEISKPFLEVGKRSLVGFFLMEITRDKGWFEEVVEAAAEKLTGIVYTIISWILGGLLGILNAWNGLNSPVIKFGVLFVAVLMSYIIHQWLQLRKWKKRFSVFSLYCPVCKDDGRSVMGVPIPGTMNRYRCRLNRTHQFDGDYHGL